MGSWDDHYFRTAFGDEVKTEILVDDIWATRSAHMRRLRSGGVLKKDALAMTRDLSSSRMRTT